MEEVVFWYYLVFSILLAIILYVKCNIYGCKNADPIGILIFRNTEGRSVIVLISEIKLCETG